MKKFKTVLLSGLLLAVAVPVAGRDRIAEIDAFNAQLESVFEVARQEGVSAASPIYVQARGHLREAGSLISRKPKTKEAAIAFSVCSVSASAALTQIEAEINRAKARKLGVARDSLLFVLHKLHETIGRIEGSKANALSQELEAQKAQASMLQGDLEASKAQASLLREDLAAERERARKAMEDARKKFDELQSNVLSVSRDARGTIISMADILFATGKADLQQSLKESLAKIAGILIVYKDPKLVVEGHTDNQGSKDFNQKLSEDRAANVKNYLIDAGVAATRLTSVGRAFDVPVADNNTKEGRSKNRRVELIIQDNPEGEVSAPPPTTPQQPTQATKPATQSATTPQPSATQPPATQPPPKQTPATQPPAQQTPATQPPATQPPAKQAPAAQPPAQQTPATQPPVTQPPTKQAPAQQTPATQPPVTQPPAKQAPAQQTPATQPPATQPPATQPPATQPPAQQPPAQQTPAQQTPAKQAPVQQAPAKGN